MSRNGLVAVESKDSRKKPPKVVDHLELHPKMGGGHIVKHVYTSYEHEPHEVHFNKKGIAKGGEHVMDHLTKHGGLPAMPENYDKHEASETEEEFTE